MKSNNRLMIKQFVDALEFNYFKYGELKGTKTRLKIDLVDFISESSKEDVDYALDLIKSTDLYEVLAPIVFEYSVYGISKFKQEKPKYSLFQAIKTFFKNEIGSSVK